VSLYNNKLTGSLPTEVGELVGLTALELGTNQLSGMVPNQIGQLKSLKTLLLDNNNLTGTVPAGVCSITGLQDFWTDCDGPEAGREITCSCCTACPNHHSASPSAAPSKVCPGGKILKPFKEMYDGAPAFTQNALSGNGWFTSANCAAGLDAVGAGFKGISGAANNFIATGFDAASLTADVLEGTLKMPTSIDVLTALTHLTLDSKFKGTTLPDLQKQTNMVIVKAKKLGLTGPFPKGAYSKTTNSLTALELSSNSFTGTLDILHAGTIATGFDFKGNKKELKLSKNFGSNLCVDTAGVAINLSSNNIVGPLPSKLCQDVLLANQVCAAGATYMNLQGNSFTGTLPWGTAAAGVWPNLVTANINDAACTVLNLSSNKISGSVNFNGLSYLSTGIPVAAKARNFDFCGNGITNTMPGNICSAITGTATNTASVLYKFETCLDPSQVGGTTNACSTLCKLC